MLRKSAMLREGQAGARAQSRQPWRTSLTLTLDTWRRCAGPGGRARTEVAAVAYQTNPCPRHSATPRGASRGRARMELAAVAYQHNPNSHPRCSATLREARRARARGAGGRGIPAAPAGRQGPAAHDSAAAAPGRRRAARGLPARRRRPSRRHARQARPRGWPPSAGAEQWVRVRPCPCTSPHSQRPPTMAPHWAATLRARARACLRSCAGGAHARSV